MYTRTAKALDQCDCTGMGSDPGVARFIDQIRASMQVRVIVCIGIPGPRVSWYGARESLRTAGG